MTNDKVDQTKNNNITNLILVGVSSFLKATALALKMKIKTPKMSSDIFRGKPMLKVRA